MLPAIQEQKDALLNPCCSQQADLAARIEYQAGEASRQSEGVGGGRGCSSPGVKAQPHKPINDRHRRSRTRQGNQVSDREGGAHTTNSEEAAKQEGDKTFNSRGSAQVHIPMAVNPEPPALSMSDLRFVSTLMMESVDLDMCDAGK